MSERDALVCDIAAPAPLHLAFHRTRCDYFMLVLGGGLHETCLGSGY
jgi:hypothetical protein